MHISVRARKMKFFSSLCLCLAYILPLSIVGHGLNCGFDETKVDNALTSLKSQGYKIEKGVFSFISLGSEAANPSSKYAGYFRKGGILQLAPDGLLPQLPIFQLGATEAVIFHGCTPPPAKYFSFRSYLVNRGKDIVAAAMGEMTNHLVINATGPDAPFNALTTMVTTADGRTLADVNSAFSTEGLGETLNTDSIVGDGTAPLGANFWDLSRYGMVHRVAMPLNATELAQFSKQNQSVWFVTTGKLVDSKPREPLPLSPLRGHEGPTDELSFNSSLVTLASQVVDYAAHHSLQLVGRDQLSADEANNFTYCLRTHDNCFGNNDDILFLTSRQLHSPERHYFMVGVNHARTNQTVYANLGLYYPNGTSMGPSYGLDSSKYGNSSSRYASGAPPEMFVVELAPPGKCLSNICLETDFADKFTVIARAVLNPVTRTGPAADQIVSPVLLQFESVGCISSGEACDDGHGDPTRCGECCTRGAPIPHSSGTGGQTHYFCR